MTLKDLMTEIDDLSEWLHEYATSLGDTENVKINDASHYLSILKRLIDICPEQLLDNIQL